jgi:ATP-binding protein involved in chromosome partitioning
MNNLKEIISQLQTLIHQELELDISTLPFQFYENENHTLLIKSGFPISQFQALTQTHPELHSIHWEQKIQSHQTQLPGYGIKNIRNAIAIASGKGGVGKSTVSTNLACASAMLGANVGLLDADIYGPSIPTMMGIQDKPEVTQDNRYTPAKQFNVECMSMGLLQNEGPLIWRGPMLAKALLQMLDQTAWSELDYLFIDLPPGTGDIPLSLTQKIPLSGAIIVTTPQTIATLDAEKALQMFIRLNIPVLGIISNMAWHECENCHHHSAIFGHEGAVSLAKQYNVPLLGELPLNSSIREQADLGKPIATEINSPISKIWESIAYQALIELAKQPLNIVSKIPPVRKE